MSDQPSQRLDKWLWAARFFKTRTLAATAVSGGKVHVNEQRCKPAKSIRPGDVLRIQRGLTAFEVTIVALSQQRRPAVEAQQLYEESAASLAARERQREERARQPEATRGRRPDKQQRRDLARLRRALSE